MITSKTLNANDTAGQVAKPAFGGGEPDNFGMVQTADVTNSEAVGEANTTYSPENRSAQFKNPRVTQDAGAGGNQYNTPQ